MRSGPLLMGMVMAVAIGVLGALGSGTRNAQAIPGDVCDMVAWDSTGTIIPEGGTIGGNGMAYVLFRVEDDAFGYVTDFFDGPVSDLVDEVLRNDIAALKTAIAAEKAAIQPQIDAIDQQIADLEDDIAQSTDPVEIGELEAQIVALEAERLEVQKTLWAMEGELVALEEVLLELEEALKLFEDTDLVEIDSQTGSARITSKMEITGFEWVKPRVSHLLVQPGVLSQRVDHVFPDWFTDPDGHDLDNISAWLSQVAGVPVPAGLSDAANVCGSPTTDGWGFVDITCIEAGSFHVRVIPQRQTTENRTGIQQLVCPSEVESATISVSHPVLEVVPVGGNTDTAVITVTTFDPRGANINGGEVKFITSTCTFFNPYSGVEGDRGMSPAGGGMVVSSWSDTDSPADKKFLTDNTLENAAGTAEVGLACASGTPGPVQVTAIVSRRGADIELRTEVTLVGQATSENLSLTLSHDKLVCGETLMATAKALDENGVPVSDGTIIYFTTDTSSGIIGGQEGGQGAAASKNGESSVTVAMAPNDPGIHTLIAYTINAAGTPNAMTSTTFECTSGVASAAPPPATQSGGTVNAITPPSTGSAGLAGSGDAGSSPVLLAGVLIALTSLAGPLAGRLCLIGRR